MGGFGVQIWFEHTCIDAGQHLKCIVSVVRNAQYGRIECVTGLAGTPVLFVVQLVGHGDHDVVRA
jgi:hypothetical protein